MSKTITKFVMAATIVLVVGYDVWVYMEPTPGDTVSEILLAAAGTWSVLPFGFGVLAGHLFVPSGRDRDVVWLLRSAVLAAGVSLVNYALDNTIPPAASLLVGGLVGAAWWSQKGNPDG